MTYKKHTRHISVPKVPGHARTHSSDRTLALQSYESEQDPKDPAYETSTTHLEDRGLELALDPRWDEAHAAGAAAAGLSLVHRTYLIGRHGTLDLDPVPSPSDDDPYNWPQRAKVAMLLLVALHACMATLTAAAIIPAYSDLANEFGTAVQDSAHLTSIQMAVLGVAPLVWRPLANTYGRRPVFLLSLVMSAVGNVACGLSQSYAAMMLFRALVAFFISPASAIGSGVVAETFFKKDRARYVGVWTVMVTLGIPVGPLVFGFVTQRAGFRHIFWILALVNGVQFILYFFLGPETLYMRDPDDAAAFGIKTPDTLRARFLNFGRINPRKLSVSDYVEPLQMAVRPCVVVPALASSTTFLFGSILFTIEIPPLFQHKFDLSTEDVGLQFVGAIVGALVGEQVGGLLSDTWMRVRRAKIGRQPPPEFRLWLSYAGYVLTMVGVTVFLVTVDVAADGRYTVVPVVGSAFAAAGSQIVTTVLVTYAIDCTEDKAASVGVFMSLSRQLVGFLGPFWFAAVFDTVGLSKSSAVVAALVFALSFLPTALVQWKGRDSSS